MNPQYTALANQVAMLIDEQGKDSLQAICNLLKEHVPHFNWVGFYFMNNEKQVLEIGPYAGAETEHTSIPYGRGICGQVAQSGKTFLVKDVAKEENYLACSLDTKAELVVPIYKGEELIGQIDIDSHKRNPFTMHDEDFLNQICDWVGEVM